MCFHEKDYAAYQLKYDSVHGKYGGTVEAASDGILVDGKKVMMFACRDPREIPWADHGIYFTNVSSLRTQKFKSAN